jgi:hypothetical protein
VATHAVAAASPIACHVRGNDTTPAATRLRGTTDAVTGGVRRADLEITFVLERREAVSRPDAAPGRRRRTARPARRRPLSPGMRELAIFAVAYLVYFGVRALIEGAVTAADAHALALIRLERDVGIAWEGAIQDAALAAPIVLDAANAVYIYGHWPVILVAGVLLFRFRRPHYIRLRDAILLSGAVGLVIFALFPVTPPRLTDLPLVDTVTRGDPGYRQILPRSLVNEYAAMPSFHAGWNLLVGIVIFGATRNPLLRALAVLIPAAMMLAAVATANHFVVDVLAGVSIALGSLFVGDRLRAHRARHHRTGSQP